MIFVYLDEFGHIGPYFGRQPAQYNASPVFGVAGYAIPEDLVRPLSAFFLKRKVELLGADIIASGQPAFKWEKKGTNLFTPKSILRYEEVRKTAFRLINYINKSGGYVFYYGRQKIKGRSDLNEKGFYTTVFSHALRRLDTHCRICSEKFVVVIDQHSARKELLEAAAKTMYGQEPARELASPPFEVESYLNQNIQAADWLAAIIGRIWAYRLEPREFTDLEPYEKFFGQRVDHASVCSTVMRRPKQALISAGVSVTSFSSMAIALKRAGI